MPFTPLIHALKHGATVITPTNRLQRELLWRYMQHIPGKVAPHPQCYSYETWLTDLYQNHIFKNPQQISATLINDWQYYLLWKTVSEQKFARSLKHHECQQALAAVKNCFLSQVTPEGSDFLYTPMAQHFHEIYQEVSHILQKKHWLPPHMLAKQLENKAFVESHTEVIWACFDTFHPEQLALIEQISAQGGIQSFFDVHSASLFQNKSSCLESLQKNPLPSTVYYYHAPEAYQEQEQIILWLKHKQKQGAQRLGLVVPDLTLQKPYLYRQLRQHFSEQELHFSLGEALYTFPLIKHAVLLLSLNPKSRLSREQCQVLLTSPFISGFKTEAKARNALRLYHPLLKEPEIPYLDFKSSVQASCPILAQILTEIQDYPQNAQHIQLFQRLNTCGFPGENTISLHQQAILQKFYQILEESQRLILIDPHLHALTLIQELTTRLQNTVHQPPQNYDGIHIMGWLESSGFQGDGLWICHFTSHVVPQPIHYSSLLPIPWQKQHQLPRTDHDKETQIATQLLKRLLFTHDEVIISMAEQVEQQMQWPSPILPVTIIPYQPLTKTLENRLALEAIAESYVIPLEPETHLKGGSYLLSVHAQCPFKAFANYRLHLAEPQNEELGLNPLQRGQLLHQCLYQIWQELKSQQALLNLEAQAIDALITKTIHNALETYIKHKPYSLDALLCKLESSYLHNLILQVLELDKQRPSFKIYGLEQSIELAIDDWPFQLRYDRMDELADGSKCLIDYKSSLPTPLPWNQEQALHPQILMYALADMQIRALLFLAIQFQDTVINGISASDTKIHGVKVSKQNWVELQQQWLNDLKETIANIRLGICHPKPAQSHTCQRCLYQDLCRLDYNNKETTV